MSERYEPPSEFLRAVIQERVPLTNDKNAMRNLRRVMALMRDANPANRDWATLLLALEDVDNEEVRDALAAAANDQDTFVRGEAILGLAQRDATLALPFLRKELTRSFVSVPLLEAAELVADPSLIDDLKAFAMPSDDPRLDHLAKRALKACKRRRKQKALR